MKLFDSHAHYNDEKFEESFPGGADSALKLAQRSNIEKILNAGTNPKTSQESIELAKKYPFVYAAAGLHPGDIRFYNESDDVMLLDEIYNLCSSEFVVALGEIGLDYHYDNTDKKRQKEIFSEQLDMAVQLSLPVIIHDREAHGDVFDILKSKKNYNGIIHSFSGSAEMARQLSKLGFYISFSGTLTYKSAHNVREAAAAVPHDKILIETDAPYLPPVPHRGKINHSSYMIHTLETLSGVLGLNLEDTAKLTYKNACEVFKIN